MARLSRTAVRERPAKRGGEPVRVKTGEAAPNGILPAQQDRSRAKQAALISSGIRLLESRDYKSLSIAELTAANGVSVGAFYARFAGKDAYFNALQQQVFAVTARDARALFAPERWTSREARDVLDAFVAFFVGLVRRHRGVIHAALQQEAVQPSAWTPVREAGADLATPLRAILVPKLTHLQPADRLARVGFAVQMLYGTLINIVLHDPGPLSLNDDRIVTEMQNALAAYLGLARSSATRRTRGRAKA